MKDDEHYIRNQKRAFVSENFFAKLLESIGCTVKVPEQRIRPHSRVRMKYADHGDILIEAPNREGIWITARVECKHHTFEFSCWEDWPYKHRPTVIIDDVYKIDKHHKYPLYAYVKLNLSMTHYIFVPAWTYKFWVREFIYDREEEKELEFYCCPKEHLSIYSVEETQNETEKIQDGESGKGAGIEADGGT